MTGMNAINGNKIEGIAHLKQSIRDILSTPLGSRVMRRDYGSRLFELIDAPMHEGTVAEIYAATAEAIERWEPRFNLFEIEAKNIEPGKISLTLEGEYIPTQQRIVLQGILV